MSTYVILGGTGKVGRRVARVLAARGHVVRPAGRTAPTRFDWRDESTWQSALDGADGVFVVGPGSAGDWSASLSRLLDVAVGAGIEHATLLSARGVEFLAGGAVDTAEQALQSGPIAWTILRPAHFAQNFTESMFVPVNGCIVAPVGEGAEPFIDVADIADVAATVLTGRGHDGSVLALSGPEALTFAAAAAILTQSAGMPISFESESDDEHVARLRAAGTPEGYITWRMAMLRGIRTGADAYLSDGVEQVLDRPATRFQDWAAREAEQLKVPR